MANFLVTCNKPSGENGLGCISGFSPNLSMSMPEMGLPNIDDFQIPDFSGISVDGIIKAIEAIGLDPCMFLGPILNLVANVISGFTNGLQNSIDGIANFPQELVDQLQTEVLGAVDDLFNGVDMSSFADPCAGVAGMLNEVFDANVNTDATLLPLANTVNDAVIGNVNLDARLTAIGA